MSKLSKKTITVIENEMKYWKIPGVSVAVIKDGKLWEASGFGYRNLGDKLPVDVDTQFGIASCSKSMTSALIAILVDKGILDYDEPVTTYVPKLMMHDPLAKDMTLRDMLSHKTGFVTHDRQVLLLMMERRKPLQFVLNRWYRILCLKKSKWKNRLLPLIVRFIVHLI